MCAVSAIHDYMRTNVPQSSWDLETFLLFRQILDKLNELDFKLGQKDCVDPNKARYLQELELRFPPHEYIISGSATNAEIPSAAAVSANGHLGWYSIGPGGQGI